MQINYLNLSPVLKFDLKMTFVVRQAIAEDGKYAQMICDEWRIPRNFAERGLLSVHRNTFRKNAGGEGRNCFF